MPRKLIQRFLPDHSSIRQNRHLRRFGPLLHSPNLWHLNRRSAAGACAVGLFTMFLPIPFQMLMAASLSILVGVNLPLSISLVWISNPLTWGPMFYTAYRIGALALGQTGSHVHFPEFELTWRCVNDIVQQIGPSFLVGCLICGVLSAVIGFFALHGLWRLSVVRSWRRRSLRKLARAKAQAKRARQTIAEL